MPRIFLVLFFICTFASAIDSYKTITLDSNIVGSNLINNTIYVGTDNGEVFSISFDSDFNNISTKEIVKLPKIKNFINETYYPKVYFVDYLDGEFLILSQGGDGNKNLFILRDKLLNIFGDNVSLNIKKAVFINDRLIFMALASNEIILYDRLDKSFRYRVQLSSASFSDFDISKDKKRFLVSCESGILYYGDIFSGDIIKTLEGANKDNVYKTVFALNNDKSVALSAGVDRKVGIYTGRVDFDRFDFSVIQTEFLVYSVGISPDANLGAYILNEIGDISVFDIVSKKNIAILNGRSNLPNYIFFTDNNRVISLEDGRNIFFWKIDL